MTKAAMARLIKSDFFHEVEATVRAWDYYCRVNDVESSNECMHKWGMAKLALHHITGNWYGFSRDIVSGAYSIVNEHDDDDVLITGKQ